MWTVHHQGSRFAVGCRYSNYMVRTIKDCITFEYYHPEVWKSVLSNTTYYISYRSKVEKQLGFCLRRIQEQKRPHIEACLRFLLMELFGSCLRHSTFGLNLEIVWSPLKLHRHVIMFEFLKRNFVDLLFLCLFQLPLLIAFGSSTIQVGSQGKCEAVPVTD